MEESNHISYFKVENFKRFESFEMENIGQFNIIVGDNNVGKTTLLEALLFDTNIDEYFNRLSYMLLCREITAVKTLADVLKFHKNLKSNNDADSINYYFKKVEHTEIEEFKIYIQSKNKIVADDLKTIENKILANPTENEIVFTTLNNTTTLDFVNPEYIKMDIPYIAVNIGYKEDMTEFYSKYILQNNKNKPQLLNDFNEFAPEALDLEISSSVVPGKNFIIARHRDYDRPMPITMFGEGAVRLLRILVEINMTPNQRLMIDEIDTGIYHKRFKQFWKTILLAAKRNNVQLFATTHSQECLRFIKEVLEEEDMEHLQKEMRCFSLVEKKDKSVFSYAFDFKQFQFAIDQENEIR